MQLTSLSGCMSVQELIRSAKIPALYDCLKKYV